MRITIEIPDEQVPANLINRNYSSGYNEDELHDLLINYPIGHLARLCTEIERRSYIARATLHLFTKQHEDRIAFLHLLQQNMKIE